MTSAAPGESGAAAWSSVPKFGSEGEQGRPVGGRQGQAGLGLERVELGLVDRV
jgi:hypothetical protein